MELSRRTALAGLATGGVAATAGCLGFVMGEDLEFIASPAAPSSSSLNETGYSEIQNTTEEQTETVEFVVERTVTVGYSASVYGVEEPVDVDFGFGSLAVIATPNAEVLGRSVNPIADMDSRELMGEVAAQTDSDRSFDPSDPELIETRTMSILGADREVDVFETTRELQGQQLTFELLIAKFAHEGDVLVVLGSYPKNFDRDRDAVHTLIESLEHPVDQ